VEVGQLGLHRDGAAQAREYLAHLQRPRRRRIEREEMLQGRRQILANAEDAETATMHEFEMRVFLRKDVPELERLGLDCRIVDAVDQQNRALGEFRQPGAIVPCQRSALQRIDAGIDPRGVR